MTDRQTAIKLIRLAKLLVAEPNEADQAAAAMLASKQKLQDVIAGSLGYTPKFDDSTVLHGRLTFTEPGLQAKIGIMGNIIDDLKLIVTMDTNPEQAAHHGDVRLAWTSKGGHFGTVELATLLYRPADDRWLIARKVKWLAVR